MRGQKTRQSTFYSYLNVEDRNPADHPIRMLRILVDGVLGSMSEDFSKLFRKGPGKGAQLCYLGHALIENRNGLVVDVEVTQASGTAEWEAALTMVKRTRAKGRATLAGDKGYDSPPVVEALRRMRVTPNVAKKKSGGGIDGRTTRHAGYAISQRRRKLVEQVFGWAKTIGGLEKTRFKGTSRVASQTLLTASAYNLIRLVRLIPWRSYAI